MSIFVGVVVGNGVADWFLDLFLDSVKHWTGLMTSRRSREVKIDPSNA